MHYTKYQKSAVSNILMHSDRGIDSLDIHEHSNENIDKSRTHLNYDLKERGGQTAYVYYKERIDRIAEETKQRTGKNIRKDAVTLCSWVVTSPKDLSPDKLPDFFKVCYAWFSERYGEDNIVTAVVHMDETTPHMHLQFTPIIENNGVRKLCAKDIETRKTLSTAHQKLQKRLEQALRCEVNIINGATEKGNKSVLELQNEMLRQQLTEKEERAMQIEYELSNQKQKITTGKEELERLEEKIKPFRELQIVDKQILEEPKPIPLTKKVVISKEVYTTLSEQAFAYAVNRDEIDNLRNEKMQLALKRSKLEQQECELNQRAEKIYKKENIVNRMKERLENINELLEQTENQNKILKERDSELRYSLSQALDERDEALNSFKEQRKIIEEEYQKALSEKDNQIAEKTKQLEIHKSMTLQVLKSAMFTLSALKGFVTDNQNLTEQEKLLFKAIEDLMLKYTSQFNKEVYGKEGLQKLYQNIKSDGRDYAKPLQKIIDKITQEQKQNTTHFFR